MGLFVSKLLYFCSLPRPMSILDYSDWHGPSVVITSVVTEFSSLTKVLYSNPL